MVPNASTLPDLEVNIAVTNVVSNWLLLVFIRLAILNSFVNSKTVGKCRFRTDFASTHSRVGLNTLYSRREEQERVGTNS
jgi:hypothetical protein